MFVFSVKSKEALPVQDIEWQRYHTIMPDTGAQYAETNPENFIVEPWNAFSSLFFLIPALYWWIKIRRKMKENAFIVYCIPLLVLGGLGSTFFHAFRSSFLLLWMDVLPIAVLTLSVSAYFWQKIIKRWHFTILIVGISFILRGLAVKLGVFSPHTAVNISYLISGITIFLPAVVFVFKTKFYRVSSLCFSVVLFVLALFFRETDAWVLPFFYMGTHFLWHILSAAGSFFLAEYLYYIKEAEVEFYPLYKTQEIVNRTKRS